FRLSQTKPRRSRPSNAVRTAFCANLSPIGSSTALWKSCWRSPEMFRETELKIFIEGALRIFETLTSQPATVGSPYLVTDGKPGVYEYVGVIDITGTRKGIVYFTAPRGMLTVLLMRMQETDTSDENIKDLVGEVANTISGNARRDFGKNFVISVPVVIAHEADKVTAPHSRSYVIPINWRTHSAKLVVCLE